MRIPAWMWVADEGSSDESRDRVEVVVEFLCRAPGCGREGEGEDDLLHGIAGNAWNLSENRDYHW